MRHLLFCSLSLAIAQVLIGVNIIIGKYLTNYMSMYTFIFTRFFISAMIMFFCWRKRMFTLAAPEHPEGKLSARDWFYAIAQGLTAGVFFNLIFYYGLQFTTATSAGIVTSSLPAVMAVLAFFLLRESLCLPNVLAIGLAICGILIINIDNLLLSMPGRGSFYGDFIVFLSMIPEALYSIASKKVEGRVNELASGFIACVVTSLCLAPLMIYDMYLRGEVGFAQWSWLSYPILIFSGCITILFYIFWGRGLRHIPVSTAAVFGGVVPITTSLLGVFFLGEKFGIYDGVGMAVIFFALFLGVYRPRRKDVLPSFEEIDIAEQPHSNSN